MAVQCTPDRQLRRRSHKHSKVVFTAPEKSKQEWFRSKWDSMFRFLLAMNSGWKDIYWLRELVEWPGLRYSSHPYDCQLGLQPTSYAAFLKPWTGAIPNSGDVTVNNYLS
jgi:hypothetical protein